MNTFFAFHTGDPLHAELMASARAGHLCLLLKNEYEPPKNIPIYRDGNRLYLMRNWLYESQIIEDISRLCSAPLHLSVNNVSDLLLNRGQQEALYNALQHPFSIITGGPGTGKTFTIQHLIKAIGPTKKIVLLAPTGKAAARLKQMAPNYPCSTLHAQLGIRSNRDWIKGYSYIDAEWIIIDECSMIDAQMFAYLLASIPTGTRAILLGDANQLAPIGAGAIFADLVDCVPTKKLTQPMRSERQEIIAQAQAILQGKLEEIVLHSQFDWLDEAKRCFPPPSKNPTEVLADFEKFRFLSCVREGPLGVNTLNTTIHSYFRSIINPSERLALPILITKNKPDIGLYNGDNGVLIEDSKGPCYALFQNGQKLLPSALPPYEVAYCMSVHKSQGSEFDSICLCVSQGAENFGREVLYTGVTRAKHSLRIIGNPEALKEALARKISRQSGIRDRLYQSFCARGLFSKNSTCDSS